MDLRHARGGPLSPRMELGSCHFKGSLATEYEVEEGGKCQGEEKEKGVHMQCRPELTGAEYVLQRPGEPERREAQKKKHKIGNSTGNTELSVLSVLKGKPVVKSGLRIYRYS